MLIAEDEEGHNEPSALSARFAKRRRSPRTTFASGCGSGDRGTRIPLPPVYKLWARGIGGVYQLAHEIHV
jgi:hypothetical protein